MNRINFNCFIYGSKPNKSVDLLGAGRKGRRERSNMPSPKGFILYRIWYGNCLAYLGRTKQPLQARIRGHMFARPMHRAIDIHNVTKIEYTQLQTEADMNLYEIYFINLWKPPLNVDDKARDNLTIVLPELEWKEFVPKNWEQWKKELRSEDMYGWHKRRNEKVLDEEIF